MPNSEVVLELAEEFLERYRQGERPPLQEYIERRREVSGANSASVVVTTGR